MGNQKDFLLKLEDLCGVKKALWINSQDTFAVSYESLVRARDLTVEHSIGRLRFTNDNSDVTEIWIDIDNHDGIGWKEYKNTRLKPAFDRIVSFGIPPQYIYPKISGTGVHLHVFLTGLPFNIDQKDIWVKTTDEGSDTRSRVEKTKLREFGAVASTGKGFAGYVSMAELMKARSLPTLKEPKYPKIKLFKCTKDFLLKVAMTKVDKQQKKVVGDGIVDYERDGDFQNLYKCPAMKILANKAKIDHHLLHNERLFVMSQLLHFGKESRQEIHNIMKNCSDYDEEYTQKMIDYAIQNNYHPFTCKWAREMLMPCPADCKGSGGKSPLKFAWTPLSLEQVKAEFRKSLKLHPDDDEVIDLAISQMLDPYIEGDLAWTFLVAPPSWAKTVILQAVHNPKWSELIDEVTDKTFISGKTRFDKVTKQEVPIEPLLPKLHMRTLMCKEFTTQLMQGKEVRNSVFGQLRSIYDGHYAKAFGSFDYALIPESWKNVRMGFFAGCTLYIDKYSTMQAILGERYLKIRMKPPDRIAANHYARLNARQRQKIGKHLNKVVTRFIANLTPMTDEDYEQPPDDIGTALEHLAEFIVQCRAPVERVQLSFGFDYQYQDLKELGTRLTQQLLRRGWGLGKIYGNTGFTKDVYKVIFRYALDTLLPNRLELVKYMYNQKEAKNQTEIQNELKWGYSRTKNTLIHLACIRVIDDDGSRNFTLNPYIRKVLTTAARPIQHTSEHLGIVVSQCVPNTNNKNTLCTTSKSTEGWKRLAIRSDDEREELHRVIHEARLHAREGAYYASKC